MITDADVDAWVDVNDPNADTFPAANEGQSHRNVTLDDDPAYFEPGPERPGVHRPPAWSRRETIAGQHNHVPLNPCAHCHRQPAKYHRTGLCSTCADHTRRTGRPPDPDPDYYTTTPADLDVDYDQQRAVIDRHHTWDINHAETNENTV
jgi:hypothetical protein